VYLTGGKAPLERRNAAIAAVADKFRAGA